MLATPLDDLDRSKVLVVTAAFAMSNRDVTLRAALRQEDAFGLL